MVTAAHFVSSLESAFRHNSSNFLIVLHRTDVFFRLMSRLDDLIRIQRKHPLRPLLFFSCVAAELIPIQ
jgi:hypothetical protein